MLDAPEPLLKKNVNPLVARTGDWVSQPLRPASYKEIFTLSSAWTDSPPLKGGIRGRLRLLCCPFPVRALVSEKFWLG